MMWRCLSCGHLHACNPSECADCGYSILTPDRTSDRSDISPPASLSDAITDAVAEAKDVNADDLRPLTDVIDTNAMECLMRERRGCSGKIQFRYCGLDVVVHPSGAIDIESIDGD